MLSLQFLVSSFLDPFIPVKFVHEPKSDTMVSMRALLFTTSKAFFACLVTQLVVLAVDVHLRGVAFGLGVLWAAGGTFFLLAFWIRPIFLHEYIEWEATKESDKGLMFVAAFPIAHFFSFTLLFAGIYRLFGANAYENLPSVPTVFEWMGFVADRFLSVVLFDANELYGFRFNEIEQSRIFLMSTAVFVYKLTVEIAFIAVIVGAFRHVVSNQGPNAGPIER